MPAACGQRCEPRVVAMQPEQDRGVAGRTAAGAQWCMADGREELCGLLQTASKLGLVPRRLRQHKAASNVVVPRSRCQCLAACLPPGGADRDGPNWQQLLLLQIAMKAEWRAPEVHWAARAQVTQATLAAGHTAQAR